VLGAISVAAGQVGVNFTGQTPESSTTVLFGTSQEFNLTIDANISQFLWNWNNTNYSMYDNDLVLMMNFDDYTYLNDTSQSGNNGTVYGNAAYTASGKYGGAISFDGAGDYINLSSETNLTGDFTMSAWVNINSYASLGGIVGKYHTSGGNAPLMRLKLVSPYNTIDFCELVGNTVLNTGTWYHVVGVMTSGTAYIYINGRLDNSGAPGYTPIGTLDNWVIGKDYFEDYSNRFFNGVIDEIYIWNRSLTAEEVNQTYYSNLHKYADDRWGFYSAQTIETNGTIDYFANVTDTEGVTNQTASRIANIMTYDGITPSVSITSPMATAYTSTSVALSFSASDNAAVDKCWYSLDNGDTNTTVANCASATLTGTEGSNTVIVYANDTTDTVGSSSVVFNVDTLAPSVSITGPTWSNYSTWNITITYTANDVGTSVDKCWYSLTNGSTNISLPSCTSGTLNATEGGNSLRVYANDTTDHVAFDIVNFTLDTTGTTVSISEPRGSASYPSLTFDLNYTVSDVTLAVDQCWYSLDGGNTNVTLANCVNTQVVGVQGTNAVVVYANDTIDNLGSQSVDFRLDTLFLGINYTGLNHENDSEINESFNADFNITLDNAADLDKLVWNWNNTNYSLYDNDLVLMMSLDDYNYLNDTSKYGNNGTGIGDIALVTDGVYGNAMSFDGNSDYINVSYAQEFNFGSNDFSVLAWINSSSIGTHQDIFDFRTSGTGLLRINASGTLEWNDGGEHSSSLKISENVWTHIAVVRQSGTLYMYINGTQDANSWTGHTSNYGLSSGNLIIGQINSSGLNGQIDEVRIYNRSLTAEEINQTFFANIRKIASDTWEFNANVTIKQNGTYDYYAAAIDFAGNENRTEDRNVTVNIPDIIPPGITVTMPGYGSTYGTYRIPVVFNISDDTGLTDKCWLSQDSGATNQSVDDCSSLVIIASSGYNTVTIYANDSKDNVGVATIPYFISIVPHQLWTSRYQVVPPTQGLILENIGNVNVSVNITLDNTAETLLGGTSPDFDFKWECNEDNSCRTAAGASACAAGGDTDPNFVRVPYSTWADVNVTNAYPICANLNYLRASNQLAFYFHLIIPSDSFTGNLSTVVTATAYNPE